MENLDITIPWQGWQMVKGIGEGGFGQVYEIKRFYYGQWERSAMKVLTIPKERGEVDRLYAEGYDEASIRNMYKKYLGEIRNEFDLLRQMKGHPNIVSCEDYCELEHRNGIGWDIYIRMELLTSLYTFLKNIELSEAVIIKLGKDICRVLIACEKYNIVHRDIKPANIMVSDYGDFKLGDFGVARTMDHTTQATHTGTYDYMAPEVYWQQPYGKEVDIYSLGLVMYWLLNGRRTPFQPTYRLPTIEEKEVARYRRLKGEKFPEPLDGSKALKRIVMKACAYRKEDRYKSARQMLAQLEKVEREEGRSPQPVKEERHTQKIPTLNTDNETSKSDKIPPTPDRYKTEKLKTIDDSRKGTEDIIKKPSDGKEKNKSKKTRIEVTPSKKETSILPYIFFIVLAAAIAFGTYKHFNKKPDFSKYDVETTTSLDLNKRNISDISDIERLTNLESLDLSDNRISDISSIGKLKNLKHLDLAGNKISDISGIENLTNLEDLYLDGNKIKDISSLENLTNLEYLYLGQNEISDINSIGKLANLKSLYLSNNKIDDISSLTGLMILKSLDLNDNQIDDVSGLKGLSSLTDLDLGYNKISDVSSIMGLKELESLDLGNNSITDVSNISNLTQLNSLTLSENKLSNVDIRNLNNLKYLYLGGNQISDITGISGLNSLESLWLNENKISDINSLSEFTSLKKLGLYENRISDISSLSALTNLEELYLHKNEISDISSLSGLDNLKTLEISDNKIKDYSPIEDLDIKNLYK